jgi:hypothetical protein
MVNRITRDACIEYLRRWGKLDEVSQDDQCNHVRLMDVCKELLPEASVQRMLEEAEPKKEAARYRTGWRLEGVLREFRPMNARYLWFEYPVHRADESGLLKDLVADGEKHGSVYKAQAARREKAKAAKLTERQQIENALAMANGGEPCTVKDLAEYMGKKEDTMRRWINRNDFEIDKNSGTIRDLTRSDGGM